MLINVCVRYTCTILDTVLDYQSVRWHFSMQQRIENPCKHVEQSAGPVAWSRSQRRYVSLPTISTMALVLVR